ncbi:MAG: tyrosine-type recombinase/integrase [Agriterribacter sp.]
MSIETLGNVTVKYEIYPRKRQTKYDIGYRFEFAINGIQLPQNRISFGLGITCKVSEWDENKQKIKGTGIKISADNKQIEKASSIILQSFQKLNAKGVADIAEIIKEIELGIKPQITGRISKKEIYQTELSKLADNTIDAVMTSYIANYDKHNDRKMSKNTKLKYDITIRYLKAFWKGLTGRDSILVNELDINHTDEFKKFLLQQSKNRAKPEAGNLDADTVRTYLSKLRALFKYAQKPVRGGGLGLIDHVPIRENLIGAFNNSEREPLSLDEIMTIWRMKDEELSTPLKRVKYLFLFMCGSGTGLTEAKSLKQEFFEEVDENTVWLSKSRTKNNKKFGVTLLPFAVDAYKWFKEQPEFFGCITSETNERLYLRDLISQAKINNPDITLYVGRSTFITNLLAEGVDKWLVKDMVGHANLSMLGKYDTAVAKIKAKAHIAAYSQTNIGQIKK